MNSSQLVFITGFSSSVFVSPEFSSCTDVQKGPDAHLEGRVTSVLPPLHYECYAVLGA